MYKIVFFVSMLVACTVAAPAPGVLVGAPIVTATSSQVVARNYNGLVAPAVVPVAAPLIRAAPYVAAPAIAAPAIAAPAFAAPLTAAALAAPSIYSPYSAYPYYL